MFLDAAAAREPVTKAFQAIVVVLCHTIVSAVIISSIWLSEILIVSLWAQGEPLIFGVPLHHIVLGGDMGVLLTFMATGTISAMRTFWH
jgi:hypothetical protein